MLVTIGDLIDDVLARRDGPLERGTDNAATIRHARGGSAANVAAAAAPFVPARFIGRVGDDTAGEALVRQLERAGVDVRVQRGMRTGTIVILVDETGERTMITDRAAAAELGPIDPTWLEGARWLHLPLYGFSDEPSRSVLREVVKRMPRPAARVSVDLSSTATMRALGAEDLGALLFELRPDVVFANRDEDECARGLGIRLPNDTVYVVKRGGDPIVVHYRGGCAEVPVEALPDVVDSTGAGDAFAAGWIAAALRGAGELDAARSGVKLATTALTELGAL
ncbi:carbohydrate kinase family protein [Microbacterium sp. BWT-B31]|uniref:carbohydrate kinase family protein n=1 Tax=Microbacterium sp. BWT-B31 TaxID=3232072 RepID=UPI0035288FA2